MAKKKKSKETAGSATSVDLRFSLDSGKTQMRFFTPLASAPTIYVLVDRDNAPTSTPHTKMKEAFDERRAFADAGESLRIVRYEPVQDV